MNLLKTTTYVIQKEQFGFRKVYSSINQIERMVKFILTNYNLRKSTGAVPTTGYRKSVRLRVAYWLNL